MIRDIVFYIQTAAQKVTLRLLRRNHSLDRLPMSLHIEKTERLPRARNKGGAGNGQMDKLSKSPVVGWMERERERGNFYQNDGFLSLEAGRSAGRSTREAGLGLTRRGIA